MSKIKFPIGIFISLLGLVAAHACQAASLDDLVAAQRAAMQRAIDKQDQPAGNGIQAAQAVAPAPAEILETQPHVVGIYGVGRDMYADIAVGDGAALPYEKGQTVGDWTIVGISPEVVTLRSRSGKQIRLQMGVATTIISDSERADGVQPSVTPGVALPQSNPMAR